LITDGTFSFHRFLLKSLMEISIRPFTPKDYDAVIRLWLEVGLPAKPRGRDSKKELCRLAKKDASLFLVAETEGKVVGTALGTHDGRKGWINRVAVLPAFRRRGLAGRLVGELEGKFRELGLEVMACLIEEENQASMELFKKMGYEEWSGKYFSKRKSPES
jgi:N-acetylglutamate synthase